MPVLVVGADTPAGAAIVDALLKREGEVRAFVTDPEAGEELKRRHVKVAVGDLSDESHVEAAGTRVFSAVLITSSVEDGREVSFADSRKEVLAGWASALKGAGVRRAIWVVDDDSGQPQSDWTSATPEVAVVNERGSTARELAEVVANIDEAAEL